MSSRTHRILRIVAGASLVIWGAISTATAQVRPDPPSDLSVEGGTTLPSGLLFFDDFNYAVAKYASPSTKESAFLAAGWSGMKDEVTQPNRSFGYLYTVASVPGYAGQIPGSSGSGRVLCMEGRPTSLGVPTQGLNQTDFYLFYGNPAGPQTNVPGNVWFQFWIFINDSGSQQSHWANRNKLIYPSDDGSATGAGTENAYMISLRPTSQHGSRQPYGARAYVVNKIEAGVTGIVSSDAPEGATYIGANLAPSNGYSESNQWVLYKIHIDHASVNGTYEVWQRTLGNQTWMKTTEWIGGVTPGFTWVTQPGLRAGHNLFKMPTTWGTGQADTTNYDTWVYMADFAMATREADLPTYTNY